MKITTKQTTAHEVDIAIPFFRIRIEYGMTELFAMLTEGYVHECHETNDTQSVSVRPKWLKEAEIVKAYQEWKEINEDEFLATYRRILNSLSLDPVLTEQKDDLKDIKFN